MIGELAELIPRTRSSTRQDRFSATNAQTKQLVRLEADLRYPVVARCSRIVWISRSTRPPDTRVASMGPY